MAPPTSSTRTMPKHVNKLSASQAAIAKSNATTSRRSRAVSDEDSNASRTVTSVGLPGLVTNQLDPGLTAPRVDMEAVVCKAMMTSLTTERESTVN